VRHGRTAWNAALRFQGRTDVPLDEVGRAQARALARHLAAERFDVALSSPLSRAYETATTIAVPHALPVAREPGLSEMAFGAWEGLTWEEIVATDASLEGVGVVHGFRTPSGGESFEELCARVAPVIDALKMRSPAGGRALVVSHAGVMHAILYVLLGADFAITEKLVPASIVRLQCIAPGADDETQSEWRVVSYNETADLGSPAPDGSQAARGRRAK
jgi:broad specificity phosphatase PhoE